MAPDARQLRVLAADEDDAALHRMRRLLEGLGHRVTAFAVDAASAAEQIAAVRPDVALVAVDRDDEHALDLIAEIAGTGGPVIALLDADDPGFVRRAADRGVDAYARHGAPADLQSAIELAIRRHNEVARLARRVEELQRALERRSVIERAKGVLMERHGAGERAAFEMLRTHARAHNRTVVDTARAVLDGHGLLPRR